MNKFHCQRCERNFTVDSPVVVIDNLETCGCGIQYHKSGNGRLFLQKHPHDMGGAECGNLVREGRCQICGIPLFGDGRNIGDGRNRCSEHGD